MKATIVLGLFSIAMTGAGAIASVMRVAVEPVTLLISGAALLALASAVRRLVP